jgi:hypothetical protein
MFDYRDNLVRNVDRKFFTFNLVPRTEYSVPLPPDPRWPQIPGRTLYKSVTTIINEKADKTYLNEWRERIGDKAADEIAARARYRGQVIHDMAEAYLMGQEYWRGHGTINILDFNRVVPLLNANVSNIYGIELPLYSHRLRTAGRTDVVCQWQACNSIVDFKTARKEKLEEQIQDYFIQTTTYALMFQEIYSIDIPQICVIILVDHESTPRVFVKDKDEFIPKVEEYFCD